MGSNGENEMAFVTLPTGIRVSMEFQLDGQLVVNVYHVRASGPITTIYLSAIVGAFASWWTDNMKANFTQSIALTRITARDMSVEGGAISEGLYPLPEAGTVGSPAAVPNNVAIVASWHTARTGRSYRGRSYYAGLLESDFTLSELSSTRLVALLLDVQQLPTILFDVAEADLCVASYVNGGVPRPTGVLTTITGVTMNAVADSQRRRLPGRGA